MILFNVSVRYECIKVQAGLPQLLLVKELMTTLVSDEDTYGECGYYLATLEAATQHICDLAEQYDQSIIVAQFRHNFPGDNNFS